jgi:hypothetical protein
MASPVIGVTALFHDDGRDLPIGQRRLGGAIEHGKRKESDGKCRRSSRSVHAAAVLQEPRAPIKPAPLRSKIRVLFVQIDFNRQPVGSCRCSRVMAFSLHLSLDG